VGTPHGPILAVRAVDAGRLNILCVADIMETKGWGMERQQQPPCIHMTLMPRHAHKKEQLIADLRESVEYVLKHPELAKQGSAAMYGMVAKIPSGAVVEEFLLEYESQVYDLPRP
jgi:sphinganine-1-phosphate aldolase